METLAEKKRKNKSSKCVCLCQQVSQRKYTPHQLQLNLTKKTYCGNEHAAEEKYKNQTAKQNFSTKCKNDNWSERASRNQRVFNGQRTARINKSLQSQKFGRQPNPFGGKKKMYPKSQTKLKIHMRLHLKEPPKAFFCLAL